MMAHRLTNNEDKNLLESRNRWTVRPLADGKEVKDKMNIEDFSKSQFIVIFFNCSLLMFSLALASGDMTQVSLYLVFFLGVSFHLTLLLMTPFFPPHISGANCWGSNVVLDRVSESGLLGWFWLPSFGGISSPIQCS